MKKTIIVYGKREKSLQKKAISILSEIVLEYTYEMPVCLQYEKGADYTDKRCIYVGTRDSLQYIKDADIDIPEHSEGYAIKVSGGDVIIAGYDDAGALYGCIDFYNKYILSLEYPHDEMNYRHNPFCTFLPDYSTASYPSIKSRGIWTWGHVIYDYRAFIDNMVRLKMNTLILWNDYAPLNAADVVEYAHACGIKLIFGYSWLWENGCDKVDISNPRASIDEIISKYEKEYLPLGADGLYFQSFTEIDREYLGGKLIAEAVTDFVNEASAALLDRYPDLELQFGLHARSVKNRLEYIERVDPRVRIVWEDCGAFPLSYVRPDDEEDIEKTLSFLRRISTLRSDEDRFGVVSKGMVKLDWPTFEHIEGPVEIGASTRDFRRAKILGKSRIWRYIQSLWLAYADQAHATVRAMREARGEDFVCTALVEDGMFECNIMYPVALYSEMMWDACGNTQKMIKDVSQRSYVDFV